MKLGELCSVDTEKLNLSGNDLIDYVDISSVDNIEKKIIKYETCYKKDAPSRARKLVQKNDILVSTVRPNLNAVALCDVDTPNVTVVSTGFCVLRCKENVDANFVFNFCKSQTFVDKLVENATGASYPAVNDKIICAVDVPYYSLEEQKRISLEINKVENLICLRKQQLQKLDELIKARFVEMFGDIVVNTHSLPAYLLKDLALLITKGASPNWQGFNYIEDEEQTLFITSENVREGYLDFSKSKYVEDGFNEKQKRSVLQKGDFLINIVGASIGRAAQFKIDKKANINQAVALVRVEDERIVDGYLLEYLNSEKALQMYFAMQSDTGRANLSLEDIGNLVILLPPVNEQRIFDGFVQEINKSKLSVQKSLDKLELLKKALMQKYFG